MKLTGGFYSDEHAARFQAGAEAVRRGGADSRICGAQTRSGGVCQQPPLIGSRRCLRHAGPHHARLHRQRQLEAFARGKLSREEFERFEARRAANALRNAWRRNPWLPGQTIDLGVWEDRFQIESGLARRNEPVPPAVLDWLRWRYRRLQIDRGRDQEWARALFEEYPRRVRDAGPPPPDFDVRATALIAPFWSASVSPVGSKRAREDRPRAPSLKRKGKSVNPSPLDEIEVSEERLARVAYEQRDVLAPLLKLCSRGEHRALIRALAIYLDHPTNLAAMRRWTAWVFELRARA
jgi:hypothetical protein